MLISRLKRWRDQRTLRHYRIPLSIWNRVVQNITVLKRLSAPDRRRLRRLTSLFLRRKVIVGTRDLHVNDDMRVAIAAQACLLILNLNLEYYRGWREVIVYPQSFIVEREEIDTNGLVSDTRRILSGESWLKGPVIVAWAEDQEGGFCRSGSNVILHEFAHKLDMQNGVANGMPPLHADMVREQWTRTMTGAYNQLRFALQNHQHPVIDPYASENPAEFFAVVSEVFFENPFQLLHFSAAVYEQMRLFYRQDPIARYTVVFP